MWRWSSIRAAFVYSNTLIALTAFALTCESFFLFGLPTALSWYPFLAGFATLTVYALHYDHKLKKGAFDDRLRWYRLHPRVLPVSLLLGALGILSCLFYARHKAAGDFSPRLVLLPAIAGLLALAYSRPVWPGRVRALRYLGGIKLLYLAGAWTLNTLLLPCWLLPSGAELTVPGSELVLITFHRFFWLASIGLLFNLYDEAEDRAAGIRTLAVMAGSRKVLRLGAGISVTTIGLLTLWLADLRVEWQPLATGLLLLPVWWLYRSFRRFDAGMPEDRFAWRYDGLLLVKALLLIFALQLMNL